MREYSKNNDPRYWEGVCTASNCGSYALNVIEWVVPYGYSEDYGDLDRDAMMWDIYEDSLDEEYTADMLVERDWEELLHMFPCLRPVALCETTPDDIVVAYRVGVHYDESSDFLDQDFHFRIRQNGVWSEKCGRRMVQLCDENDPWELEDGFTYNSRIMYAIRIDN